jgi:predicted RNA-binding protein YlqC (UPF0109 family)
MAKKPRKSRAKSVMQTDIKDLQVSRALRRLGNVRVTEWEFRDILPKVKKIAATDVDVVGALKRTANLQVNSWDLSEALPKVKEIAATEVDVLNFFKRAANVRVNDWEIGKSDSKKPHSYRPPTAKESKACVSRLTAFLDFVTHNLVENPDQAAIKVSTPSPSEIRFRLILSTRDSAALIGHGGHTATAIRNLIKDAGTRARFFVDLTRAKWNKVKTAYLTPAKSARLHRTPPAPLSADA